MTIIIIDRRRQRAARRAVVGRIAAIVVGLGIGSGYGCSAAFVVWQAGSALTWSPGIERYWLGKTTDADRLAIAQACAVVVRP